MVSQSILRPDWYPELQKEVSKVIIGQEDILEQMMIALLSKGHALLIGPPGMAKTTLVQSFAKCLSLPFGRIQFTPDLMPSDILGTEILQENRSSGQRELVFIKGPVFTQILLADEINRTPPKTQAALLQAMQEKTVTIFGRTETLETPFMVLATQNPIEQEGTYPLPEAQLDRFLLALHLKYPAFEEEVSIVKRHSGKFETNLNPILSGDQIRLIQEKILSMTAPDHVYEKAVRLVRATRPQSDNPVTEAVKYVKWGASPRAAQFLLLAAKARAFLHGRPVPVDEDLITLFHPTMNHRIQLNFQAEADGVDIDSILEIILKKV